MFASVEDLPLDQHMDETLRCVLSTACGHGGLAARLRVVAPGTPSQRMYAMTMDDPGFADILVGVGNARPLCQHSLAHEIGHIVLHLERGYSMVCTPEPGEARMATNILGSLVDDLAVHPLVQAWGYRALDAGFSGRFHAQGRNVSIPFKVHSLPVSDPLKRWLWSLEAVHYRLLVDAPFLGASVGLTKSECNRIRRVMSCFIVRLGREVSHYDDVLGLFTRFSVLEADEARQLVEAMVERMGLANQTKVCSWQEWQGRPGA